MSEIAYEVDGQLLTQEGAAQLVKEKRDATVSDLIAMRNRWIQHRAQSGVEGRWREAKALYNGEDIGAASGGRLEDTLKDGPTRKDRGKQGAPRSKVVVNIVRPKVDQAIAKFCDTQLPVDAKNWGMKPSPVPDGIKQMVGSDKPTIDPRTGQPTGLTAGMEATAITRAAQEACEGMERVIDDQLSECNYNAEQRSGIENAVILGTMVMIGPEPGKKTSKKWSFQQGVAVMQISDEIVPRSRSVDCWDIWFDPACGKHHQRGSGFWERRYATARELRSMVGLPGFDEAEVRDALREKPSRLRIAEGRVSRSASDDDSYELFVYHGDIDPLRMSICSMNTSDPLEDVDFGVVVFCNDKCIGAMPSWVPDRTLPVDVWCWRATDDSPFGTGLPHELKHQQAVVKTAWRQLMDNARATLGSQIIMRKKGVNPQNEDWNIDPLKVWIADPDIDDIRKVFATFDMPSRIQELLAVVESAMKYADQETSMPQILGGERGTAPETVGGMVMLNANAGAVTRHRTKLYDDNMTSSHIGRYFDWNMEYHPDNSIKYDSKIIARGTSMLIEQDITNQAILALASVTSNPRYQSMVDPELELKLILKGMKIQPKDVMFSDDRIKENNKNPPQPQPDPRVVTANLALKGKQLEIEDNKEQRAADVQMQREELAVKEHSIQYNVERERAEGQQQATDAQLTREVAIAKLNADLQDNAAERDSVERLALLKLDNENNLFNAEAALRVHTGAGI